MAFAWRVRERHAPIRVATKRREIKVEALFSLWLRVRLRKDLFGLAAAQHVEAHLSTRAWKGSSRVLSSKFCFARRWSTGGGACQARKAARWRWWKEVCRGSPRAAASAVLCGGCRKPVVVA